MTQFRLLLRANRSLYIAGECCEPHAAIVVKNSITHAGQQRLRLCIFAATTTYIAASCITAADSVSVSTTVCNTRGVLLYVRFVLLLNVRAMGGSVVDGCIE